MGSKYFDHAATTRVKEEVLDAMLPYLKQEFGNPSSMYTIGRSAKRAIEAARKNVAELINANTKEIIFTSGSTESLSMIIYGYFKNKLKENDEVLITKSEHASNILPWFDLEKKLGIKVKFIPLNDDYSFNINNLEKMITNNTKVVSLAETTNVIGDTRNIKEISKICHDRGILFVVDAAQSSGHKKIDVQDSNIDFMAVSAHKMLGPTGVGILYGKEDLLNEIDYDKKGGGITISFDDSKNIVYKELPYKLESGTQNIAGVIGFKEAINYINKVGLDYINEYIINLKKYLISKLKEIDNIIIYNENIEGSTVTFNIDGIFAQDVAIYLDKYNICVRSGDHCDKKLSDELGIKNTVRVSLFFYNTKEECDRLVEVLKNKNILEESLGI